MYAWWDLEIGCVLVYVINGDSADDGSDDDDDGNSPMSTQNPT